MQNIKETDWMKTFIWTAILVLIAVTLGYAVIEQMSSKVVKLEIDIPKQDKERLLISKKTISKQILKIVGKDIRTVDLIDLDLTRIETLLEKDSRIENVEVFINKENTLKVEVEIRRPFVRVIADNGDQFYLDAKGVRVSTVKNQAIRVPVVTGNVDEFTGNWINNKKHNLNEVFLTAKALYKDDFLYALVEQIYINDNDQMTLIPKVGPKLFIGDTNKLNQKLLNLKSGYKQILSRDGWEGIDTLNFSIPNQIRKVKPEIAERVSSVILTKDENHKL